MIYRVVQQEQEYGHIWTVASASCTLSDPDDPLLSDIVALVRRSYGEEDLMADAAESLAAEIGEGVFDTAHLLAAIRSGLPDPAAEGEKPPHLTTYRSQAAEMVAKAALLQIYGFQYPAAPQAGSSNANMPILGFDGWGLIRRPDNEFTLVLIQVKATDANETPPGEAKKLAIECAAIPRNVSALARALTVLARLLRGDALQPVVFRMLAQLGNGTLPDLHVAPAIVRGTTGAQMSDFLPIRANSQDFEPATARGVVVSIGAMLNDFGRAVMQQARRKQ